MALYAGATVVRARQQGNPRTIGLNTAETFSNNTNEANLHNVSSMLYSGDCIDLISDSEDDENVDVPAQQQTLIEHVEAAPHMPMTAFIKIEGGFQNESMILEVPDTQEFITTNAYNARFIPNSSEQQATQPMFHSLPFKEEDTIPNNSQQENVSYWDLDTKPSKPIITSVESLDPVAAENNNNNETETEAVDLVSEDEELTDEAFENDFGTFGELPDDGMHMSPDASTDTAEEADGNISDPPYSPDVTDYVDLNNSDVDSDEDEQPNNTRHPAEQFAQFFCPQCDIAIGNYLQFKEHTDKEHEFYKMEHLQVQVIIDKNGKLCYKCKSCTTKFPLKTYYKQLYEHRITHLPQPEYVKCRLCEKRFKKFFQLVTHLRNHHKKLYRPRPRRQFILENLRFYCPICNVLHQQKVDWAMHLELVHEMDYRCMDKVETVEIEEKKVYKCLKCKKKIPKSSIMQHVFEHEEYKPFECKLCNSYTTASLQCARRHVRTHLRLKRFNCTYCEAKFHRIKDFEEHQLKKHDVPLLSCPECERSFITTQKLHSHFKRSNHHKMK